MTPNTEKDEARTRREIDANLTHAGWVVQDKNRINLFKGLGVVVREMDTTTGPADYMLFVDGKACGIIEAKREGATLVGVAEQSQRYATAELQHINRAVPEDQPLPFLYEATNHEVRFRDERDPRPRSRNLFHFHRPETLKEWLEQDQTLRRRIKNLPDLDTANLRNCQIDAIHGIENSLKAGNLRTLLQMATGSGKTYTAVTEVYRLAQFAKVGQVLFLVDRSNLAGNAREEFEQFVVPNDGRKFTQHYNVAVLGRAGIPDATKVTISTIQRLYSQLTNTELDDEADERSGFETDAGGVSGASRPVRYNPTLPIEQFDLVIVDECHRSIYNLWRQVLDYFDAFLIGLTATPTKKTIGFFGQNLASEYTHENAVVDKVNVGYDIYRIKTGMTERGNVLDAGATVEIRDKMTKQKRLEVLDQQEEWLAGQLDRSVLAPNQIRTVIRAFRDQCLPECFPDRKRRGEQMEWVPKTLIFAKDDDHCDRIVDAVREVFNEGNAFCKKITYKVGKKTAEESIKAFRTDPQYRIAVSVDMIATGTDIRPLECVMFMRDVKSQAYYEQMKGRGTRTISRDELHKVTPDAPGKDRFVLVDCVGVTETDKTETKSLETKPNVPTDKLIMQVARGDRHSDTLRTLGNRMIRLDLKLDQEQRQQIADLAGKPLAEIAGNLINATNEDTLIKAARTHANADAPTEAQIQEAFKTTADNLVKPFHTPELRDLIEQMRKSTDQLIDDSADEIIEAGYDIEKAENLIKNWRQFIQAHQNELDAIQLIYQQPYQTRRLSSEQIDKLAGEISRPPYNLAPIEVWKAYEQLEKNRVKGVPTKEMLTNIVSLIRFSTGMSKELEPFPELVESRFENWLSQQDREFAPEQMVWLGRIKDQIARNAEMTFDDFNYVPFNRDGGLLKARELFGEELEALVGELNGYLIA